MPGLSIRRHAVLDGARHPPPPLSHKACDFLIASCKDNERFGLNNWHAAWDGNQEEVDVLRGLSEEEQAQLSTTSVRDESFRRASAGE